jgi:hypothetical protein
MEEAPEWLEQDVNVLKEEGESQEVVPLPVETHSEEEIECGSQPLPPQRLVARRRHLNSASTLAPTPPT